MPRLFALITALGALFVLPSPASAKIPDPRFSQVDPMLLGSAGGTHAFRVTARDVTNAPLYGVPILLDFSATTARLYSVQEPGATLDCAGRKLTRWTGVDGVATFRVRFGGCTDGELIQVSANGVTFTPVPARSTDMDAVQGCGMGDFAMFAPLYLNRATNRPDADFNNSGGAIDMADLSIFVKDLLDGSTGTYCP